MNTKSILLIEDDELDVMSVERSLSKSGLDYRLYTAYNGLEALTMLNEGIIPIPDIILLDIYMPVMGGIEFLNSIKEEDKFKDSKIFVMTISNDVGKRETAMQLGAKDYYIKPLNFSNNNKRSAGMDSFMQFYMSKILN